MTPVTSPPSEHVARLVVEVHRIVFVEPVIWMGGPNLLDPAFEGPAAVAAERLVEAVPLPAIAQVEGDGRNVQAVG
ncbi:hypothetical protein AB0D57_37850 [Streptomyces sp. NPDC048275]|uniref:hypothetical protein n=1 Tax=Streptomyces sp. NPDC048275 TaxID=3155629 RepID=UPI0033D60A4A